MVLIPRELELHLAVAKIAKYAAGESGDTVEVLERPQGGISLVLADGQQSGHAAKLISNIAARKILSLLADGVRDGAAARAAHDYLRTLRGGKVSAEVSILSADLVTGTLVISRNSQCPALIFRRSPEGMIHMESVDAPSEPIGIYERTKPVIAEVEIQAGMYVLLFSDGLLQAGRRRSRSLDIAGFFRDLLEHGEEDAERLTDALMGEAIRLDEGRPVDDTSVVVVSIRASDQDLPVRRMNVRFPF